MGCVSGRYTHYCFIVPPTSLPFNFQFRRTLLINKHYAWAPLRELVPKPPTRQSGDCSK